ncbi:MAG: MFS transporter [Beijerinckiaceae bacterium]|jgi:FSR family fosmidomycin resistance protein-like MFS transporter
MQEEAQAPRSDAPIIGLVSFAHMLSHFYMLCVPPLFPLLRKDLGLDYVDMGLTVTIYAVVTGAMQTPMGFLVDRLGGRVVLIGGLFVNAIAIFLAAYVTGFWGLAFAMALGGLGSSVFHPADYTILNAAVSPSRIGRALSVHALAGNLGFLAAPPFVALIAAYGDWTLALRAAGALGVVFALVMALAPGAWYEGTTAPARKSRAAQWRLLLGSPRILSLFAFYMFSSAANSGIVHFSVVSLHELYGAPLAAAAVALTIYQAAQMLAVLPGGYVADKVSSQETVLAICFAVSGVAVAVVGVAAIPYALAVALLGVSGGMRGLVNASRDVSVRHAAGAVSVGTVFAFVTTGYSCGQVIGPIAYGLMVDMGRPNYVFWLSAAFSFMGIATMLVGMKAPAPQPAE